MKAAVVGVPPRLVGVDRAAETWRWPQLERQDLGRREGRGRRRGVVPGDTHYGW